MELKNYIGNQIKSLRKQHGMTQTELANQLDTTKQTISRYERGLRKADQDVLFTLCEIFNVAIDDFFPSVSDNTTISTNITPLIPEKSEIQEVYDSLEKDLNKTKLVRYGKELRQEEIDEQEDEEKSVSDNVIAIDDYRETISLPVDGALEAGTGVIQENNLGIDVTFYVDEIPDEDEYDGIAMVVGRSMEPVLYHGDYLFIDSQAKLEISDIAAFQINGKNVVKKYRTNMFGTPYLESINDDYDDIYPTEDDDFRVLGVVIDVVRTGK